MPDKCEKINFKKAENCDYYEIYQKISKFFDKWIKNRSLDYVKYNIKNYFVYKIDWKIIWCVEKIQYSKDFIEMWSVFSEKWFNLWKKIISDFLEEFWNKNIFAVTWNDKIIEILEEKKFSEKIPKILKERLKKSFGKRIFLKMWKNIK